MNRDDQIIDRITHMHAEEWNTKPSDMEKLRRNAARAVRDGVTTYAGWKAWLRNVRPFYDPNLYKKV